MQLLELTLDTPQRNIALDEALLQAAEVSGRPGEVLRFWEPTSPVVVVGRSSQVAKEVHHEACIADGVPLLRRSSGGAAIVTAPGCLMYGLVLSYELRPALRSLDEAHRFVLGMMLTAINRLVPGARRQGICDLTLGDRKFSGNSVRCQRNHLLYHGTVLYRFPLELLSRYLGHPGKEPDYRGRRSHDAFVANLPVQPGPLRHAIAAAWGAAEPLATWPLERVEQLVTDKYSRPEWNFRH